MVINNLILVCGVFNDISIKSYLHVVEFFIIIRVIWTVRIWADRPHGIITMAVKTVLQLLFPSAVQIRWCMRWCLDYFIAGSAQERELYSRLTTAESWYIPQLFGTFWLQDPVGYWHIVPHCLGCGQDMMYRRWPNCGVFSSERSCVDCSNELSRHVAT